MARNRWKFSRRSGIAWKKAKPKEEDAKGRRTSGVGF